MIAASPPRLRRVRVPGVDSRVEEAEGVFPDKKSRSSPLHTPRQHRSDGPLSTHDSLDSRLRHFLLTGRQRRSQDVSAERRRQSAFDIPQDGRFTHSFFSGRSLMTSFLHRRSKNGLRMLCSCATRSVTSCCSDSLDPSDVVISEKSNCDSKSSRSLKTCGRMKESKA